MHSPDRSLRTRIAHLPFSFVTTFLAALCFLIVAVGPALAAPLATSTTLAISSTSVPYKTPITLTATVTAGGSPVTTGLVMFCDASAPQCESNSALLAQVQLTTATATATVKIGSGPLGTHSYTAVYRANSTYSASTSNAVSYTVQGTYSTATLLGASGSIGSYALATTVNGLGSITAPGPSGTVTFRDTSAGNNTLGTKTLGTPVLSNTFTQADDSPFAIGDGLTTSRSLVVASAYLDGDNNLDVITGDADHVVTVLLGNGDGTFQSKVNYPGCPQITPGYENAVQKILLADFNRDGKTDVALGCSDRTHGGVGILLGNGDGSFQSVIWQQTGDLAGLAMGDFNNDGILDLAFTNRSDWNVKVMLGNGDGTFHADTIIATTPNWARNIVVADFDRDGNDDIAYAYAMPTPSTLSYLYVALGKGDGTFKTPQQRASSIGEFLTSGDVDGDKIIDVISSTASLSGSSGSSHIANSMFVLIGKGDGTFKSAVTYLSDIPSDPHLADVNGDGNVDIIAGGSYGALVYRGNGDGTFQDYDEPVIGGFALTYAVNAGDYNNDGNADLIGTDANNPRAAVALSEMTQAADAVALTGVAVFPLGSGIHNVDAAYSGDSIYLGSNSATVPLRAAPVPTTLALTTSPNSAVLLGQQLTLTATLSPYTVGPPTTTTDGESVNFYSGSTLLGSGTLTNGVATFSTLSLPAGSVSLNAVFPGDTDYLMSTSSTVPMTVTSILVTSSPNPSTYGQSVVLTATLSSSVTGTVVFKEGSTVLASLPVSGTTVTTTVSTLGTGSHVITATYSDAVSYASATSPSITQVVNKTNPIMSVTTSGQSTYLALVTITATAPADATGSIIFTTGSTTLGTGTINSGTASITTTALPIGDNTITASYAGDTNYNAGTATTQRAVTKASPSSTLTSSLNPSTYGSSVTFTDTLSSSVASGNVTFKSDSTVLGIATVTNGVATLTISSLNVGSSTITATYNGDANNNSSVATLPQVVNKTAPTLTLTSSLNPSVVGQAVTLSAALSGNVTGTITFSNGATTLGTVTVASGSASVTLSSLPIGTNSITAIYSGDANNQGSTGTLNQVVNKADSTLALTASANPSVYGGSVALTATLSSSAAAGITGTVSFSAGSTVLGTAPISSGVATLSTTALSVGSVTITAIYAGDSNNNGSNGTLNQAVNQAASTITLASSANPSTVGQSIIFTATVSTGATGNVVFTSGATNLGTVVLSGGTASLSTSSLGAGSNSITASYAGDSNYSASTDSLTQTVNKKTPTMVLTTSGPSTFGQSVTITATLPAGVTGSVQFMSGATSLGTATVDGSGVAAISTSVLPVGANALSAAYGGDSANNSATATTTQTVSKSTPTVTVSTPGTSTIGASVTITASVPANATGNITFTDGATILGTAVINSGAASISTASLPLGASTITASYGGDSNYNSASGTASHTVSKATPTLTVASSQNPSSVNQSVTLTATLPSTVTGSVSFAEGATSLGSAVLNAGVASISTSSLAIGSHLITASFAGDSNNNSTTGSLTQVVNQNTTSVTVTTSGPSTYGDTVTITATVPTGATGTVIFASGGTTIGTGTVNPSTGTVSTTTSSLPVGSNTITATYSGDTNYSSGSGSTTQTVSKLTPTVTVTTSGSSTYGETVTITTTVTPGATGTITVISGGTTLGTATINPSTGTATVTTSALPIGTSTINVTYGGDANHNNASGSTTQTVNKATPSVTLVSSRNPSTLGEAVTFTATVPTTATGTIAFEDGSTLLGSVAVVNGVAAFTASSLNVGTHAITAIYSGDSSNNTSTSNVLSQVVNKFVPVLPPPIVSDANPAPNTPVTITEQVPSGVTGTVTFSNGGTTIGTATIVGGTATITVPSLPIGSNQITASVGETVTYTAATSPATTVTVGKLTPTVTLTTSLTPSQPGQNVVFTATVPAAATGSITFEDGSTVLGTATVVNGIASISNSSLSTGSHTITAAYGGDTTYNTGVSAPLIQVVGKATPVLPPPAISNPNPTYGGTETITETVPPGVSGPVTFYNGSTPIGSAPIVNGVATITVSNLPVGTNSITASTPGDANNNPATSPATIVNVGKTTPVLPAPVVSDTNPNTNTPVTITEHVPSDVTGIVTFSNGTTVIGSATVVNGAATITVASLPIGTNPITASVAETATSNAATSPATNVIVGLATPTVTLTSSANPAQYGQSVTFTATIPSTATGTMTFLDGATVLRTSASSGGLASFTTSSLAIGTHNITASYAGDSAFRSAVSSPLSEVIGKVPTTITLTVSSATVLLNSTVTFTAVVAAGVPTPTGTITFMEGTTVLGTAPMSTNGVVVGLQLSGNGSLALSSLSGGTHAVTAVYSGDSNFLTSVSAPVSTAVHDFTNKNSGDASHDLYPGDTATYKFTLAPVGTSTFLSNVSLNVAGIPQNASYTLSSSSLAAGVGSTDVTLTVKTSKTLNTAKERKQQFLDGRSQIALGLLGFAGLGTLRRYRRRMPKLLVAVLLLVGSLMPLASLAGCAGGYYAPKPTTYTVTITGTEGNLQRSATATLVLEQ